MEKTRDLKKKFLKSNKQLIGKYRRFKKKKKNS